MTTNETPTSALVAPTQPSEKEAPGSIRTTIRMFAPDQKFEPDGLYHYAAPIPDKPQSLIPSAQPYPVIIKDLRIHDDPVKAGFSLETSGFEVVKGLGFDEQALKTLKEEGGQPDQAYFTDVYYQDCVELLKMRLGKGVEVRIIEHQVRHPSPDGKLVQKTPAKTAHGDQDNLEGLTLVEELFGLQAAEKIRDAQAKGTSNGVDGAKGMIINVWKLLKHNQFNDWPLAMMDARTLNPADLIPALLFKNGDLKVNDYRGLNGRSYGFYGARRRDAAEGQNELDVQQWWYLSSQRVEEALLLRIWDSDLPSNQTCIHASFQHPDTPEELAAEDMRLSIEVRAVLYFPGPETEPEA